VVIDRVLADRQQRAIQRVLQILDSLKQADPIEELALLAEARLLSRDLLGAHPRAYRHIFALTSNNLGKRLGEAGRLDEAVPPLQDAVRTYRSLAAEDRALFLIDLATSLNNVAAALHNLEDEEHARAPADESVVLCRELVSRDSVANTRYLIAALNTQWAVLNSLGQTQPALKAIEAVVACGRDAVASGRSEALESLAMSLSNAAIQLDSMGRLEEALQVGAEACERFEALAEGGRARYLRDVALSCHNLSYRFQRTGQREQATAMARRAVQYYRELACSNRWAFLPHLAGSLSQLGSCLAAPSHLAESLALAEESVALFRELVDDNRTPHLSGLARALHHLGVVLGRSGHGGRALQSAREAVGLRREQAQAGSPAAQTQLVTGLVSLGQCAADEGLLSEALAHWREAARLLLAIAPTDPDTWTGLAWVPALFLGAAEDLRDWHLPLLALLPEHRELAYDASHAELFLKLQADVAARAWAVARSLGPEHAALVDEAVTVLVATLQGPDLSRWLQAQGTDDERIEKLARLKRGALAADQAFEALLAQMRGPESDTGTLQQRLHRQADAVRQARADFRAMRQALIGADERFRSAFESLTPEALRADMRHIEADATLFLLQLCTYDETTPRAVGALVDAQSGAIRLLAFDGLFELCEQTARYRPHGDRSRTLRDIGDGPAEPAHETNASLEDLAAQMRACFGQVLSAALSAASSSLGGAPRKLHVCCHGVLQQLPLGLDDRPDADAWTLHMWPGLPYLRLAARRRSARAPAIEGPWLLGHDCAWRTNKPLPMVALESALLRELLRSHGRSVARYESVDQIRQAWTGVVACCHGSRSDTHLDTALALGHQPLSVADIVQERPGVSLALLPACHAGETREDAAGNSLGIAAAFLLGGTRVVAASSKAVPDVLMPWFSTLVVWHLLQGLPPQHAARQARAQFGTLAFPPEYRVWLQTALPQALRTLQPGGSEHGEAIGGTHGSAALQELADEWPWEGDSASLFSPSEQERRFSSATLAAGVLRPRAHEAEALAQVMREMAAFVFVYGAD
jgi:tetratricopeptide (TPR) repeat protein